MHDLIFTIYKNCTDTTSEPTARPWVNWIPILTTHERRAVKDGPAVVLAEVQGRRSKAAVKKIYAVGLDFDNLSVDDLLDRLTRIDQYESILYTTYSHTDAQPKVRVILPLADPLSPEEYPDFRARLDALIPGSDPGARDMSRLFFLPSCPPDAVPGTRRTEGKWISSADLPALPPSSPTLGVEAQIKTLLSRVRKLDPLKPIATALLGGTSLAKVGERHNAVISVTWYLAQKMPSIPRPAIEAVFAPSIKQMPGISLNEVWTSYQGALEKQRADKIQTETRGQGRYSTEELGAIAAAQGCTVDELSDRWIIQSEGGGWLLDSTGDYEGPYSRHDLPTALFRTLRRAPVGLYSVTAKGGLSARPIVDIVRDNGRVARKIVSDMTAARSRFEARTATMREAVCRRREIPAQEHPEIDQWLRVFAGSEYSRLVDWISAMPDLDELLCAIYLHGPKGTGKSLLVHGLAKIWTTGNPTPLDQVISNFNDSLVNCPLIFADERLPRRTQWDTITEDIREMVSVVDRELTRKFRASSKLRGAIRLVLAANHEMLLRSVQTYTREDQEAIAQRLFYLQVPPVASEFLSEVPSDTKKQWGRRGIAEHALWLAENHEIQNRGDRFVVEGGGSLISRLVVASAVIPNLAVEWLTRYLNAPEVFHNLAACSMFVRRHEGRLLVNVEALLEGWELYMGHTPRPDTARMSASLRSISLSDERVQLRHGKKRIWYRPINTDYLWDYSTRNLIGDPGAMTATLNTEVGSHKTKPAFALRNSTENEDAEEC